MPICASSSSSWPKIVKTESHLVISALAGDAAAGGVPFAMAADYVVAREDVVLNPYYGHMGGLYGSEYWTPLMPRRIGHELTEELTSAPFEPIGTRRAVEIGLLDDAFGEDEPRFRESVRALAEGLAVSPHVDSLLEAKRRARRRDEQIKSLSAYRAELGAPCVVTPAALGAGHPPARPWFQPHPLWAASSGQHIQQARTSAL